MSRVLIAIFKICFPAKYFNRDEIIHMIVGVFSNLRVDLLSMRSYRIIQLYLFWMHRFEWRNTYICCGKVLVILDFISLSRVIGAWLCDIYQISRKPYIFRDVFFIKLILLDPTNISTDLLSNPFIVSVDAYIFNEGSSKALLSDAVISS